MTAPRPLKKSEFLEVRLPHPVKQAFMARCQDESRTASEAVRGFIDGYLAESGKGPRRRLPARLLAAGVALMAFGLAAAPSFARTTASGDFARLDANHDGGVSLSEFERSSRVQVALSPAPSGWLQAMGLTSGLAEPALDQRLKLEVAAAAFREIDSDRNGSITLAEYRRFRRT